MVVDGSRKSRRDAKCTPSLEGGVRLLLTTPLQRRFDRVKRSANQDHVRHRRSIAFVFTTVPRDFRLGGRFGGFN